MTAVSTPATQEKKVIANFGVIAFTLAPINPFDLDAKPTILEIRFLFDARNYRFAFQQIMADEKPRWAFTNTHPAHHDLHLSRDNHFFTFNPLGVGTNCDNARKIMKETLLVLAKRVGESMATDLRQSVVATITMKTNPVYERTLTFTYKQSVDVTES